MFYSMHVFFLLLQGVQGGVGDGGERQISFPESMMRKSADIYSQIAFINTDSTIQLSVHLCIVLNAIQKFAWSLPAFGRGERKRNLP